MQYTGTVLRNGRVVIPDTEINLDLVDRGYQGWFAVLHPAVVNVGDVCHLEIAGRGSLEVLISGFQDNTTVLFDGNGAF